MGRWVQRRPILSALHGLRCQFSKERSPFVCSTSARNPLLPMLLLLCLQILYQHHLNLWFESLLILDLTKQSDVDILWVPLLKILFSCASFFSIIFYFKKNEGDLCACFWIMRIEIVVSFYISILARLVFGFDGDD